MENVVKFRKKDRWGKMRNFTRTEYVAHANDQCDVPTLGLWIGTLLLIPYKLMFPTQE